MFTRRSVPTRKQTHQRFYTWVAVGTALIIFTGFARTYYLKGLFGTPPLRPLLRIHGLVMTAWFVLFFLQVRLIAAHRTDVHRRLGVAGAVVAGLVVAIDTEVALRNAHQLFIADPGSQGVLAFLGIALCIVLLFGILVGAAVLLRRRPDYHKRLMALASLSILGPGIDRLPLQFIEKAGQWELIGLWDLCAAVCIAADTFKNRRLHPAWIWGGTLIVGLQVLTMVVRYTPVWQWFAAWLAS